MRGLRSVRPARASILGLALVTLLAACGGGDGDEAAPVPVQTPDKAPTTAPGANDILAIGETDLGPVLVDADGFTLYAFLNDGPDDSNCNGACAGTWPPVVVDGELQVGLFGGDVATAVRDDGSSQVTIAQRPLYRFSGDQAPGDVNGQGVNGKWFVVDASGRVLDGSSQFDVGGVRTALGDVLVDAGGLTLYAFLADTGGVSTCNDQCAANWPPVVIDGSLRVGEGVTAPFGTTTRADGTVQLTAAGRPLYRFSGDDAPGDVNGQNVNGKWFVVNLAGELVQPGA
jgi:predicted lipoprotein with Yx(FWY)xxD motif